MASNSVLAKLAVQISANTAELNSSLKSVASSIGIAFGVGQLINFGRGVIDVTSQFQRFGAVLSNTIGKGPAIKALEDIRKFAIESPFEVGEVTAAYVRWANQGLDPTIDRMKKLGDVASSLGAGFEQTAEAFKDLLVGQTKRIEEIGISATQVNGKIQLSFKGVNIEIEKNKEGVQKALDVYSQLNGVLGTSDQVAETLGGKISTLADSFHNLQLSIGGKTEGVLFSGVKILTDFLDTLAGNGPAIENLGVVNRFLEALGISSGKAKVEISELEHELQAAKRGLDDLSETGGLFNKQIGDNRTREQFISDISRISNELGLIKGTTEDGIIPPVPLKDNITTVAELRDKLKELHKEFENTDSTNIKALTSINLQTTAINEQIKSLEKLGEIKDVNHGPHAEAFIPVVIPLDKILSDMGVLEQGVKDFAKNIKAPLKKVKDSFQDTFIDIGGLVSNAVVGLAEALGEALTGTKDFGKAFLGVLGSFMKQFGSALIAMGIGEVLLKTKNPIAMIAGGAALVAAGAVLSSLSKQRQQGSLGGINSSGNSGSSAVSSFSNAQDSKLQVEVVGVLRGQDIYLSGTNYQRATKFLKPNG